MPSQMVARTRIERVNTRVKIWGLATWLPRIIYKADRGFAPRISFIMWL